MSSILAAATLGCSGKTEASGPGTTVPGRPVESRPPEAAEQRPTFTGQTRAPYKTAGVAFAVKTIASGLEHPWAVALLPDGRMLVTERPGRLRLIAADGAISPPIDGLPPVDARDQGGLLDVILDPAFDKNGVIFWSYAEPREGGNGTAVARGTLASAGSAGARLEGVQVIWRMTPTLDSTMHFGSRLVFSRDGTLFVTTGERSLLEGRHQAQRLDGTLGKVVRIQADGSIPRDNPFVGRAGARAEIWSIGHRNLQSAALHPETGALWTVEHGARGGDELNRPEAGKDYGWPTITYGKDYSGEPIGEGITAKAGLEQPIYYWDPVIAPSGMAFYRGERFPGWKGSLFVGGLASKHLARLTLEGDQVVGEERLLTELDARIRDVRVGADGTVYVLTDADDGKLLALVPR